MSRRRSGGGLASDFDLAANRLSAHFDMIDVSEAHEFGSPSHFYDPDIGTDTSRYSLPTPRRRFLPRLWDVVSISSAASARKRFKEISLWPDLDDAVNSWFPLDGEEGELVEDEGFLDALDAPSPATPTVTVAEPRKIDIITLLPPEIALQIFLYLDLASITTVASVSSYWSTLSRDTQIWRELFFRQPHWQVNPMRAARRRLISRASRASSTFASPAALYSRWGRNSLLSLRSVTNEAHYLEAPPLTLALDWIELYKTRTEIDRRWASGEPKLTRLAGHSDSVYCLEFDQHKIITGSRDKTIKIWSTTSGKLLTTLRGHEGSVLCLKFESSSGFMVSGSSDRQVLVWDLNLLRTDSNMRPKAILSGHTGGVLDLKLDSKWIVSCAKDTTVRVWSRASLQLVCTFRGHTGPVNAIDLSPTSKRIISASGDGTLILWDIPSQSLVRTFSGHSRGLACVAFVPPSPTSTPMFAPRTTSDDDVAADELVVSGSNDKTIRVWRASTGECVCMLEGHDGLVRALAYDPLTERLVSASYDRSVILWELKRTWVAAAVTEGDRTDEQKVQDEPKQLEVVTAKRLREFKGYHSSHIFDVKFDVTRIISSSHDRKIVILDFGTDLDASVFSMS